MFLSSILHFDSKTWELPSLLLIPVVFQRAVFMQIVTLFNGTEPLKQAEDFVPKLNCNAKETMIYLP